MISTGRFFEFVREFTKIYHEEHEDKMLWEIWIHKVFDNRSFAEFKASLKNINNAAPTQEETAEVVRQSKNLLNGFRFTGVGENGTIQAARNNSN